MRKKSDAEEYSCPGYVFLGKVNEIGYEPGKKVYKQTDRNDLQEFEYMMNEVFDGVNMTQLRGSVDGLNKNIYLVIV